MEWIEVKALSSYFAAYVDQKKSLPHRGENGLIENPRALPFWIPEQRYLADLNDYKDQISKLKLVEHIVNDPFLNRPIIKFYVEKGRSAIYDGKLGNGMILLQYTADLMAYRKREDGTLGLESISGLLDTRLSVAEAIKYPKKFPKNVRKTTKEEANFSNFDKIKEEYEKEKAEKEKKRKAEEEKNALKVEKVSKTK